MVAFVFVANVLLSQSMDQLSPRERVYMAACTAGVSVVIEGLKPSRADELRERGLNSCRGSLVRLRASGELNQERDVPEFACGYAVGAMFAKLALNHEIQPQLSPRARKFGEKCLALAANQGALMREDLEKQAPTRSCYGVKPEFGGGVVYVVGHEDGVTLVLRRLSNEWSESSVIMPPSTFGARVACPVDPPVLPTVRPER